MCLIMSMHARMPRDNLQSAQIGTIQFEIPMPAVVLDLGVDAEIALFCADR